MEPNIPASEQSPPEERINVKRQETKLYYHSEYVTRDELDYHKTDHQKIINGECVTEVTLKQKRFHCQHLCQGIKNWGREIHEPPRSKNKQLQTFYKKNQYLIVCNLCSKDCNECGSGTSVISGSKHNGTWLCHSCLKKAKRKEFWQKIKNIIGGKWW